MYQRLTGFTAIAMTSACLALGGQASAATLDFESYTGGALAGQDGWGADVFAGGPSGVVLDNSPNDIGSPLTVFGKKAVRGQGAAGAVAHGRVGDSPLLADGTITADFSLASLSNTTVFGWTDLDSSGSYNVFSGAGSETGLQFGFSTGGSPGAGNLRFLLRAPGAGTETYGNTLAVGGAAGTRRIGLTLGFNLDGTVTLSAFDYVANASIATGLTNVAGLVGPTGPANPTTYSGVGFRSDVVTGQTSGNLVDNLSVIPEPSSIALAGLGLLAMARRRRSA